MKTVCFDFDGVIHSYISGWRRAGVIGIKEAIDQLRDNGYEVVISSSRCSSELGCQDIEKYLKQYDIEVDNIVNEKPAAVCYIDDRAICFDGDASSLFEKVENFHTWQEERDNDIRTGLAIDPAPPEADEIHSHLKSLPADVYLQIFHMMQQEIGYNPVNPCAYVPNSCDCV